MLKVLGGGAVCLTSGDERTKAEAWCLGEALLHAACGEDAAVVEGAREVSADTAGGSRIAMGEVDDCRWSVKPMIT